MEQSKNPIDAKLISQVEIEKNGKAWHVLVFKDIASRLSGDSEFPCIFSKNAFRKQLIKFIFVETIEEESWQYLAEGLTEYVELSKRWDGNLDTAYPLIVAFSLEVIQAKSVEDYQNFGWQVLQKLHEIDPDPWPEKVAHTPQDPLWSMCFKGMQLFCNMSNPAHSIRKSRNLGQHFILVINPRERFDIFAGNNPSGKKVRANIRNRIECYDGVPHALQLGSYENGGLEWTQYGLIEENIERTDRCPFKFTKSSS